MDEVIVKPASLDLLQSRLSAWMARRPTPTAVDADADDAPALDFDGELLNRFVGNDIEAQNRFLGKFVAQLAGWLPQLRSFAKQDDWEALRASVHRVQSAARAVGAARLADICLRIEHAIKAGRRDDASVQLADMPAVLDGLGAQLRMRNIVIPD